MSDPRKQFYDDLKKRQGAEAPPPAKRPKTGYETEPTDQLLETLAGLREGLARSEIELELKLRGELPGEPADGAAEPPGYEKWDTPRLLKAFNSMAQGPNKARVAEALKARNALPESYRPPAPVSQARQKADAMLKSPPPGVAAALTFFGILGIVAGAAMIVLGFTVAVIVGGGLISGGIQALVGGFLLLGAGRGLEILWEMRCAARATLEIHLDQAEKD